MPETQPRRKILILNDEPSIGKLFSLVKRQENGYSPGGTRKAILVGLNPTSFDRVIVDLRCLERRPKSEVHGIRGIQRSVMGRMLVMTVRVNGPRTLGLIERYLLRGLPNALLWLIC